MTPYGRLRRHHPRTRQALLKHDGQVWNVARLLLEYTHAEGQAFVNTCGYEECVEPSHWSPTKPARNAAVIHAVKGGWALYKRGRLATRDTVIIARVPIETVWHIVRVFVHPDLEHHQFLTVCGVACDPGLLVITAKLAASCEACLC